MSTKTTHDRQPNRSRQDWLDAALEIFATDGIRGVQIERLARRLGITKSGFYFHFGAVEVMVRELLEHYERWTREFEKHEKAVAKMTPIAGLEYLIETWITEDWSRFEPAMRQWSHDSGLDSSDSARQIVREADRQRRALLANLLKQNSDELNPDGKARILFAYLVAERDTNGDLSISQRLSLAFAQMALLL